METVQTMLEQAAAGSDFYLLLGDFLDEFYRVDTGARQRMIADAPHGPALNSKREHLAFMAAAVHKLANDYHLDVPPWVWEPRYYLYDKPFFDGARGNLRLWYMYKSPSEFKHRNLFVDENALVRV